jgi:hypothetical protein
MLADVLRFPDAICFWVMMGAQMHRIAVFAAGLFVATALLVAAPAEAEVRVRYAPTPGFTDAGNNISPNLSFRGTLTELSQIFRSLGQPYLPAGERLNITVLDINVAGIQPLGGGVIGGPRIVTSATPPRIKVAYALYRGGAPVAHGVDDITDLNFLYTQNPKFSSGPLYYERRILRDWFEERFRYRHGLGRVAGQ